MVRFFVSACGYMMVYGMKIINYCLVRSEYNNMNVTAEVRNWDLWFQVETSLEF